MANASLPLIRKPILMNKGIDQDEVRNALKKIFEHKLFSNSHTYKNLLEYLVEKALAGEDLKEYTIGSDLYGINYALDKNNGKVRSYMYILRKRLATYYREESKSVSILFKIEKGQYKLTFLKPEELDLYKKEVKKISIPIKTVIYSLISLSFILLFYFGGKAYWNRNVAFWRPFLNRNANNLVVISDHYVVMEANSTGEKHAVLYGEIRNDHELNNYLNANPDRNLEVTDFTLMSKIAPFGLKMISDWFSQTKTPYNLELESNLTFNNVRENNILFIGQYKTMNISRSLFLSSSNVFSLYDDGFQYKSNEKEIIYNTKHNPNVRVEYAMVSYTSLSPGKKAFYFVSNNDIGAMATLRCFTDRNWLREFVKQLPGKNAHFNALFEVSGIQRTDVSCKLVELEVLDL